MTNSIGCGIPERPHSPKAIPTSLLLLLHHSIVCSQRTPLPKESHLEMTEIMSLGSLAPARTSRGVVNLCGAWLGITMARYLYITLCMSDSSVSGIHCGCLSAQKRRSGPTSVLCMCVIQFRALPYTIEQPCYAMRIELLSRLERE